MKPTPLENNEKGQSLVEFAFSLVFLLILLAGIADLGRALFTYLALRDAAQEGALYASLNPTQTSAIKDRVYNASDHVRDLSSELIITVSLDGAACAGNGVTVKVTHTNFPITMPFLGTFLGSQRIKISASVSDTILTPPCQ